MFTQGEDKRKNEFAEWYVLWNGVIFGGVNVILTIPLPLTLALFIILMFKSTKVRARLRYYIPYQFYH